MAMFLKRSLLGLPLKTAQAREERLSKRLALAVFSSDALSSVAYATEEILLVLILAGSAAVTWSTPVSLAIIILLVILTLSYRQTIFEYPSGGGAYIVSKANLGELPALTAAAALLIDYVLTVSVSVAAGIAAVTSALPGLLPHREAMGIAAIVLVVIVNLRGVRECGRIFAAPTYLFILCIFVVLGVGAIQLLTGQHVPSQQDLSSTPVVAVEGLTLFLLLRAFASGCTALTGVEAISNGIPAFKPPESENAATTMNAMALILGTMFIGISLLAYAYGILPRENETVVSQIARVVFGGGPIYYLVQASTMLILVLAANTSFADFPRLASLLARDGYMPHQMTKRGDRLVFSNGIIFLGLLSCALFILFHGDTHALIPLYAVGVFLSFTLSQAGMVGHWLKKRGPRWRKSLAINGLGASTTGIATLIIASTKFLHGAWIVVGLLPLIIWGFRVIRGHYVTAHRQVDLHGGEQRPEQALRNTVIIPVNRVNWAVIRAMDYAKSRSADLCAVLVDVDQEETTRLQSQWRQWGRGVNLIVLPSPYRSVLGPLLEYIKALSGKDPQGWVTVVIPEIIPARWWQHILHNQSALLLKGALLFTDRVIVIDVPFHLSE